MGCVPGWLPGRGGRFIPRDGSLFFSLKFFICILVGIIRLFLVIPEAKILVSKQGAAGCSSLVGKIPLIAGFRTHGRKASAGKGITLGKRKSRDNGTKKPLATSCNQRIRDYEFNKSIAFFSSLLNCSCDCFMLLLISSAKFFSACLIISAITELQLDFFASSS